MLSAICRICGTTNNGPEVARMRGASREVCGNEYSVWKCQCGTVNALEEVDFDAIYKNYPMHMQKYDLFAKIIFAKRLRLMRKLGLEKKHKVLDYGCGSGYFVRYLSERGYDCKGYDPFNLNFSDRAILGAEFDFVMAQDVIEHDDEPKNLLTNLSKLVKGDGRIVLGTPYSDNVDIHNPVDQIGLLHQPFHRFVVSWREVGTMCNIDGWKVETILDDCYVDTLMPFANSVFLFRLFHSGGAMDYAFEPIKPMHFLKNPKLLFWGFFGGFFPARQTLFVSMRRTVSV